MATVALTMHSKQPKRAMISCEKAYIEIMEFPRADRRCQPDEAGLFQRCDGYHDNLEEGLGAGVSGGGMRSWVE